MRRALPILLFLVFSLQIIAEKLDKAYKYLDKGNTEKSIETFKDVLSQNPNDQNALFGLAKIYLNESSKQYNFDLTLDYFKQVNERSNSFYSNKDYTSLGRRIDKTLFKSAKTTNTIKAYESFLDKCVGSSLVAEAIESMHTLAFGAAKKQNSIESYTYFIEQYPDSKYKNIAIEKRDKLAFELAVKQNTVDAVNDFVLKYPDAEQLEQATTLRNEMAYSKLLENETELLESKTALQEAEIEKNKALIKQQVYQRNSFIIGFILVSLLGIIAVIGFLNTKKKKEHIEKQKLLIQRKNKKILDSIKYARYIQDAILPSGKLVKEYINESFILYKPKDIVSGDFYWVESIHNLVIFCVADCTGHGVPGAIMSMIGHNGLNKAVREKGLTKPSDILDDLNKTVNETLVKSHNKKQVSDGMDIALCVLDTTKNELQFAGAHNPLYLFRDGSLNIIKANKHPIGRFLDGNLRAFNNNVFELNKGDTIYVFSDGYIDQFGGKDRKKFKSKNFKNLLLSIQDLSMSKQKETLDKTLEEWRSGNEQTDDICLIGVRIT